MTWWMHPDEAERQDEARASEDERRREEAIADVLREFALHEFFVDRANINRMADEIVRLREQLAAVTVTEAMVEAAAKALYLRGDLSMWCTWEDEMWRYKETYYEDAKAILAAALTAASDGASDAEF